MTDPERLLRNPSSPLSSLVMRAGAEEKPSASARSRAGRAAVAAATGAAATGASAVAKAAGVKLAGGNALPGLAGGAAAGAGGTAASTGTTLGVWVIAKWLGMGALGGAIAAPLMHAVVPEQGARQAQPLPALIAVAPAADPSRRSNVEGQAVPEVAGSANPYERERGHTPATRIARPPEPRGDRETAEAPAPADDAVLAAELAAEVRFVDRGRAALQRGAFEETLGLLASYEARFPRQQLFTEVLFLRMEALSRSGDAEQARTLAARVITRGIAGPQAARARQVLGR